jgi:hypothetical protein
VAPSKLRSLHSAIVAVVATGVLSISIPVGLMIGAGSLAPSSVIERPPLHNVRVSNCDRSPIRQLELAPGQCVLLHASGFAGAEQVQVRELARPGWSQLATADATGRLSYRFELGFESRPGSDVLSFVGLNGHQPQPSAASAGSVEINPAHVAFCRFTVTAG